MSTVRLPPSSMEGPECGDRRRIWDSVTVPRGVADAAQMEAGRKAPVESQMKITRVSVLWVPHVLQRKREF